MVAELPRCPVPRTGVSPRERVLLSFAHQQPDFCPHSMGFTQDSYKKMAEFYGDPLWGGKIGNHFATTGPNLLWTEPAPGYARDGFGVIWNRSVDKDIGVVEEPLLAEPTLEGYELPDAHDPGLYQHLAPFVANNPNHFRMANIGFSLFERAWTLRGMENLLIDMILHPEFVEELLDAICDWNVAAVHHLAAHDFDAIGFGDDWGQQHGLIMGPEHWHHFLKPRLKRMYDAVHEHGMYVWIHSCGDVQSLFGDLIELGANCFNPFQPEAQDVEEAKRVYGDRLAFHGGVSLQQTLSRGTPAEVRAEVRRRIEVIGRDGGYVLAPCHAVTGDVPAENIHAMLEETFAQYDA
ncbi:MAG: uroporphyrinogen decarboxylase [Armatimonadetes bacterium]|nr:uroporphyrinogen decarboxylase [Armatimonadota bacterium]